MKINKSLLKLRRQIYRCKKCGNCHKHEDLAGGYEQGKILIVGMNPLCRDTSGKCELLRLGWKDRIKWSDNLIKHKDEACLDTKESAKCVCKLSSGKTYDVLRRKNRNQFYVTIREYYGFNERKLNQLIRVTDLVKHASHKYEKKIKRREKKCFNWFIKQLELIKPKLIIFQGKPIFKLLEEQQNIIIEDKNHILRPEEINNNLWGSSQVFYACIDYKRYRVMFTPSVSGRARLWWIKNKRKAKQIRKDIKKVVLPTF